MMNNNYTHSRVSIIKHVGMMSVLIMILNISKAESMNFDLSPLYGIIPYAGPYFDRETTGFSVGTNAFFIFVNGGIEYNPTVVDLEAYLGVSPLTFIIMTGGIPETSIILPNVLQTQIGYSGGGTILKVRTDLCISSLFENKPPTFVLSSQDRGLRGLMFTAGYEYYVSTHDRSNYQVALGLAF